MATATLKGTAPARVEILNGSYKRVFERVNEPFSLTETERGVLSKYSNFFNFSDSNAAVVESNGDGNVGDLPLQFYPSLAALMSLKEKPPQAIIRSIANADWMILIFQGGWRLVSARNQNSEPFSRLPFTWLLQNVSNAANGITTLLDELRAAAISKTGAGEIFTLDENGFPREFINWFNSLRDMAGDASQTAARIPGVEEGFDTVKINNSAISDEEWLESFIAVQIAMRDHEQNTTKIIKPGGMSAANYTLQITEWWDTLIANFT